VQAFRPARNALEGDQIALHEIEGSRRPGSADSAFRGWGLSGTAGVPGARDRERDTVFLQITRAEGWAMGSNASTWDVILHYWTVTMFVPAVLLIIVALATITRMVDD
jgi:hypothetical protein